MAIFLSAFPFKSKLALVSAGLNGGRPGTRTLPTVNVISCMVAVLGAITIEPSTYA